MAKNYDPALGKWFRDYITLKSDRMKQLIKILCLISLVSCNLKEDKVEIYLLKSRMKNVNGVSLDKTPQYKQGDSIYLKKLMPETTVDTSKMKFIFAGKFEFKDDDIEAKPFITNDEILKLDTIKGKIEFSNSGGRKLLGLKPNLRNGTQFIITVNKNPVFSGYVWSPYSSNGANWFCIQYEDTQTAKDTTLNNYKFLFYKGLGTSDPKKREKIDFKKYPELLEAFKESDRLKEDKNN
ncbi:hypothetical protein NHF50_01040 [Flavobacterium sp. NRK F10]|uniref:hypothetical protein n=1 Tax=Flavobacterium sp. NRK F10 TaxID=2954931 RepID=UPI0020902FFD|nr:hypothetical protein [Flavobacterium sp. NRK F10]MCO6173621.1 hypothetical protein [Flavobacterium sp. NRK F10]